MMSSSLSAPVPPLNLPTAGVERTTIRGRLLGRLRGEQSLRRLRARGLRAHAPVRIAARVILDEDFAWAIEIGAYTIIANDVLVIAHDAASKRLTGYTQVQPVTIGQRCYVGAGTIILPGTTIGDNTVIGAGALVRGDIPAGSVAVGSPAQVVGSTDALRERHHAQMSSAPVFERWPAQLSTAELQTMRTDLIQHGCLYVL